MFYFTCNESKIYESFTFWNKLQEKNNFCTCTSRDLRSQRKAKGPQVPSRTPVEWISDCQQILEELGPDHTERVF